MVKWTSLYETWAQAHTYYKCIASVSRNNKVRNNQPLTIDLCSHLSLQHSSAHTFYADSLRGKEREELKRLMRTKEFNEESVTLTRASHYPQEMTENRNRKCININIRIFKTTRYRFNELRKQKYLSPLFKTYCPHHPHLQRWGRFFGKSEKFQLSEDWMKRCGWKFCVDVCSVECVRCNNHLTFFGVFHLSRESKHTLIDPMWFGSHMPSPTRCDVPFSIYFCLHFSYYYFCKWFVTHSHNYTKRSLILILRTFFMCLHFKIGKKITQFRSCRRQ